MTTAQKMWRVVWWRLPMVGLAMMLVLDGDKVAWFVVLALVFISNDVIRLREIVEDQARSTRKADQ